MRSRSVKTAWRSDTHSSRRPAACSIVSVVGRSDRRRCTDHGSHRRDHVLGCVGCPPLPVGDHFAGDPIVFHLPSDGRLPRRVGLGLAGLQGERSATPAGGLLPPLGQIPLHRLGDLGAAGGEMPDQLRGEPDEVSGPVDDRLPGDAQLFGELVAEQRLVDRAAGFGVGVGPFGVDGPPSATRPHPVDHHHVGVDLRIVGPGGEVVEGRRHVALRVERFGW